MPEIAPGRGTATELHDVPTTDPLTPKSLIRFHLYRPWSESRYALKPKGIEDPCGDCGKPRADHPIPMLTPPTPMTRDDMARRVLAMENALRYIAQPTMGYDLSCPPEEFAREKATDENARMALATCILMATEALR